MLTLYVFQREIWSNVSLDLDSPAQLVVTPWSQAGRGHLAIQSTGSRWYSAGSAEDLGVRQLAGPSRAALQDQSVARPLALQFEDAEASGELAAGPSRQESAAPQVNMVNNDSEDGSVFGDGGEDWGLGVVVAGQLVTEDQWLAQLTRTPAVRLHRIVNWGQEGESPPSAAAADRPTASEDEWSGDESPRVSVQGSAGQPKACMRHSACSPADPQASPLPDAVGLAGGKAPQRRSKVGYFLLID